MVNGTQVLFASPWEKLDPVRDIPWWIRSLHRRVMLEIDQRERSGTKSQHELEAGKKSWRRSVLPSPDTLIKITSFAIVSKKFPGIS